MPHNALPPFAARATAGVVLSLAAVMVGVFLDHIYIGTAVALGCAWLALGE